MQTVDHERVHTHTNAACTQTAIERRELNREFESSRLFFCKHKYPLSGSSVCVYGDDDDEDENDDDAENAVTFYENCPRLAK